MSKKASADEKFEQIEFDLFGALKALDKKDYSYYDKLTDEQKKKFTPFMMTHYMSQVKSNKDMQAYYVRSVDYFSNIHLFNEQIQKHPKLQWLMLCASSPDIGVQFHQWVPHLSERITKLKQKINVKESKEYFSKIYSNADQETLEEFSSVFANLQNKKVYLAQRFPTLKYDDIEVLAELVTDEEIKQYEKDLGN